MTHTKLYLPPYSPAEIEEMRTLLDAERYAEYHAYNWIHRGRDWSRHVANSGNWTDSGVSATAAGTTSASREGSD